MLWDVICDMFRCKMEVQYVVYDMVYVIYGVLDVLCDERYICGS